MPIYIYLPTHTARHPPGLLLGPSSESVAVFRHTGELFIAEPDLRMAFSPGQAHKLGPVPGGAGAMVLHTINPLNTGTCGLMPVSSTAGSPGSVARCPCGQRAPVRWYLSDHVCSWTPPNGIRQPQKKWAMPAASNASSWAVYMASSLKCGKWPQTRQNQLDIGQL